MLEPQIDNSNLDDTQGLDTDNSGEALSKIQAQLSASSNEGKLLNEVTKVVLSKDFEYFQDLLGKDKTMSERVIEKIASQKGMEIDEVRELLMANAKPKNMSQYDIEQKVKDTMAKQEGEKALEEFINKVGLSKDKELSEEFLTNFNDYMEGKTFNITNVKKFSKSAYRDLNEDKVKSFEKKKGEIEAQISNGGNSKKTETNKGELWSSNSAIDW